MTLLQQENILKMLRNYYSIYKRLSDFYKPDEMKEIAAESLWRLN